MGTTLALLLLLIVMPALPADFDARAAERFARLALDCVHREYPNKIAHVMSSDEDALPPRKLTPAFYGCFDWHSAVHGHWLLARLARQYPEAAFAKEARAALDRSLTPETLAAETLYLERKDRESFERPYGLAWLLQLGRELREWDDQGARPWRAALEPLEHAAVRRLEAWLPKLSHPVRSGEHTQSAFALGLIHDWTAVGGDAHFRQLVEAKIRQFYLSDVNGPIAFEPSGEDFLSPCLAEADVVRRVLAPKDFGVWFDRFLREIPLRPEVSPDPSDGKLAHLNGLNLSRAWMLEGIAGSLPESHPRLAQIRALAHEHREAGLRAVTGEHYAGGHWLGSFAVYLVTGRGLHGQR